MSQNRRSWRDSHGDMWFLEPTLLLLLHHGVAHGYALINQLADHGLQHLHSSVAYRTLRDMEDNGWVTSNWDLDTGQGPPRRVYRLTALGDEVLKAYIKDLEQVHAQIADLINAYYCHIEEGEGDYH